MKSFILSVIIVLIVGVDSFSQARAVEGTLQYQKGSKRVAIVEVPFDVDVVEGALRENLARNGVREERGKGLQIFKNARLTPTDGEVADLYFKVESKGSSDSVSVVYLIMGRPGENVGLRPSDDAYRVQDAKKFLSGLESQTRAYDLERKISKRDDDIKKSERKLKYMQEDQLSLEQRMQDLQDRLLQSKKEQDLMNAEIARLRNERDALISKRKTD